MPLGTHCTPRVRAHVPADSQPPLHILLQQQEAAQGCCCCSTGGWGLPLPSESACPLAVSPSLGHGYCSAPRRLTRSQPSCAPPQLPTHTCCTHPCLFSCSPRSMCPCLRGKCSRMTLGQLEAGTPPSAVVSPTNHQQSAAYVTLLHASYCPQHGLRWALGYSSHSCAKRRVDASI
eukprot:1161108-Pelagomonas_calceolata.AAC.12